MIDHKQCDTKKTARSKNGMVAAAHGDAAIIGAEILRRGGNAFDAAVATGFALGVCEPNASGLGGGGFMTARSTTADKNIFVDWREVAPMSATPSMWRFDEKGNVKDGEKEEGGKSVCVPGEVAGLCHILKAYGTMTLGEVLEPVIELAKKGVIITEALKKDLEGNRRKLERFAEKENPYLKEYQVGEHLINIPLANTLDLIATGGADAFYDSEFTDKMIKSLNSHGGDFKRSDFKDFKVRELSPLRGSYRGYDIISSPPPSSGGTHVIEILNILENFDLKGMELHSQKHLHLLSEVFKMCFADRAEYMGDPQFVKLPLKGLLSKEYAKKRANSYDLNKSLPALADDPNEFETKDTTHFSIADKYGNVVAITKTISAFFGSGVVPEGTGFVMNCQMRGFVKTAGKTNSVSGGKKPLSSMSPTIILKDNKPFSVIGTPGANRIITTMSQIISNLIDFEMPLEEAINAPRCSNDNPNIFHYESRIVQASVEDFEKKGQEIDKHPDYDRAFGGVQGICYDEKGEMTGVADPRRDGRSVGV